MARVVSIVDDITGDPGASRRDFAVGPDAFTIDLTDEGWEEFQAAVRPWVERGVRVGPNKNVDKSGKTTRSATTTTPINEAARKHTTEETAACRDWAVKLGIPMRPDGGRIAADIWQGYRANDPSLVKPERWKGKQPQGDIEGQLDFDKAS